MNDLAKKLYSSKKAKFALPVIIILVIGIYLSFFSPKATDTNTATKEQPVKPATTIGNKLPQSVNFAEPTPEVTMPEKDSQTAEEKSPLTLSADSLDDKEPKKDIKPAGSSAQQEPINLVSKNTQPISRGTSSQKQTVPINSVDKAIEKPPVEKPKLPEETTVVPTEGEPQSSKSKEESTRDTNENESINPALFKQDLNSYVLDIIKTYEIGKYPYLLNTDYKNYNGVTTNINYQGSTIAKANPNGDRASHCVGITFEVFFKAMQERNKKLAISPDDFNGMNAEDLRSFMLNWFVSDGVKPQQNCSVAIEKYGLGKRIYNLEEAKPGDFIDISRENNTGHTAVFLNWIKKDGKIIGLKYWGSQSSTNGIAYKEEYFNVTDLNGKKYGNVMFDQIYIGRVGAVEDYKSFR